MSSGEGSSASVSPPTGVLTLVFTDIEDSSLLSERFGAAFEPARATHYAILREELARHGGYEVHTAGDSLFAVFVGPLDALSWAIAVQRSLLAYAWPDPPGPIRIRTGLYTGEPILGDDNGRPNYYGPIPNRAARVAGAAHGGQILVAHTTYLLVEREAHAQGIDFKDLGTHRLKGVGEERLWQANVEGLPDRFLPPATLGALRHNLPLPPTPFFGRESDVAALTALLMEGKRLVTLTGFGGMGKTRTALHVAELCAETFPGGAWWCDLAEARTGDAMLQKVGFDLGLDMQPPPSARERLLGWLRDRKRALLVLDNLEQVTGAETVMRDLLAGSSELVCLVTSRRRLGLQSETVYELPPMPPATAVSFFVERARARQPDFILTSDNAADVAELCRHLEGVPLAMELAAARVATMTPRQIVTRLGERFRLLQVRSPDLPERQRALRTTIDWSYDLLDEDLRFLFAQLSVFSRTGFTLDDVEAVCESFDPWEGVTLLRDHSLLRTETESAAQITRFYLLESLAAYAVERLAERPSEEIVALYERHARRFLTLAEAGLARLRTVEEAQALAELERIVDDLRAAVQRTGLAAAEVGSKPMSELHALLCLALGTLLFRRGFSREALIHVEAGLSSARTVNAFPAPVLRRLLRASAGLNLDLGQERGARQHLEEARDLQPTETDPLEQAEGENLLGQVCLLEKHYPGARSHFRRALELRRSVNASPVGNAVLLNNLGLTESKDPDGDPVTGVALLTEALAIRRTAGDQRGVAATLNNLGTFAFAAEDWDASVRYYSEALGWERRLQHGFGVALALNNLAEALEQRGDHGDALRYYAAAAHLFHESGSAFADYARDNFDRLASAVGVPAAEQAQLLALPQGKSLDDLCKTILNEG